MIAWLMVVALSVFCIYVGMAVRGSWRTAMRIRHERHPERVKNCNLCQERWWNGLSSDERVSRLSHGLRTYYSNHYR